MNELEAWEEVERLYEKIGVARQPGEGETCLLYAMSTTSVDYVKVDVVKMWTRMMRHIDGQNIVYYNDEHTKEENLELIRECRLECAAEQTERDKAEERRDLGVSGFRDSVQDHLGKRSRRVSARKSGQRTPSQR
jgi:hypothetical protein